MTAPLVTYPAGSTAENSTVAAVSRAGEQALFVVARTPCHPESPRWPDQPEDRCALHRDGSLVPVRAYEGYLLEASGGPGDTSAPAQVGVGAAPEAGVACVVHGIASAMAPSVGEQVTLRVDEPYREALSRSHSRCHLVSLALNAVLEDAWRKEPPARDSLGNPDFDKLAIVSSKIDEHGSLDCYRVGKHLRKAGFSAESLDDPQALAEAVSELARSWLLSSPSISVTPGECTLDERRTWTCELPGGRASFPCGGTHPSQIEPDEGLEVAISWDPPQRRLEMLARSRTFHL